MFNFSKYRQDLGLGNIAFLVGPSIVWPFWKTEQIHKMTTVLKQNGYGWKKLSFLCENDCHFVNVIYVPLKRILTCIRYVFGMRNLQYEIETCHKIYNKGTMSRWLIKVTIFLSGTDFNRRAQSVYVQLYSVYLKNFNCDFNFFLAPLCILKPTNISGLKIAN